MEHDKVLTFGLVYRFSMYVLSAKVGRMYHICPYANIPVINLLEVNSPKRRVFVEWFIDGTLGGIWYLRGRQLC